MPYKPFNNLPHSWVSNLTQPPPHRLKLFIQTVIHLLKVALQIIVVVEAKTLNHQEEPKTTISLRCL